MRIQKAVFGGLLAWVICSASGQAEQASISQGRGTTAVARLFECTGGRPTPVGRVTSSDGKTWTVPAENSFQDGPKAPDLYNQCSNVRPADLKDVELEKLPVRVVDGDGEIITAYLMADNYFELYINGQLVGVDAVPFTPFNSAVVRFKVKRPYTIAVKLVDWEENLGLGTEAGGGDFHPGDGGFIARFSDGTVTDASWRAQAFYIAPLSSPADVVERGNVHDTTQLGRVYPQAPAQAACGANCFAAHYPIPADWARPAFRDEGWPAAVLFTKEEMGLNNQAAFNSVAEAFGSAQVIWSLNLVYDNVVLTRKSVR